MLINRAHVKRALLDASASMRGGKFTRVSNDALEFLESRLRSEITALVRSHPSMGKTVMPPYSTKKEVMVE